MDVSVEDDWGQSRPGSRPGQILLLVLLERQAIPLLLNHMPIILAAWHSDLRHPGHKA